MNNNATKLKTIYHVSDIHIKHNLHEDITHAFKVLVKTIADTRETSGTILVIAGDLFEHKSHMSQHDSQCFTDIIEMLLSANITTIMMPGNHDFEPTNELDLITPLLMNRDGTPKFENIYCYAKSGVYKHMGVEFHILSPIDNIIPPIEKNNTKKIAIIHEMINNSQYSSYVGPATGKRFGLANLSQYDFALLGDIHMYQSFGGKKEPHTIAYCGSLVQKDRSEGLTHGYIKWDVNTGAHTFVPIPLKRAYITLDVKNNLFDFKSMPDLIAKEIIINHINCTPNFVDKIYEAVVQKYGLQTSIIPKDSNPKVVSNNIPGSEIVVIGGEEIARDNLNFNTIDNQLRLISAYLKQIGKSDIIEQIHTIHREYAKEINLVQKWKLEWMRWSNISCFGEDNFINFNDIKGIGSILGKNKTGKSSVITALMYCLTYKTGRITTTTIDDLINKNFPDEISVIECGISIGNNQYIIHNNLKESSKSHILMDGLRLYTDSEKNSMQKILKRIIGDVDIISAISIKIQDISSIADQKDTALVKTLDRVLGLSVLSEVRTNISQVIKSVESTLTGISVNKISIENLEKQLSKNNEELLVLIKADAEITEQLKQLGIERDGLISDIPKNFTVENVESKKIRAESALEELEKQIKIKKCDQIPKGEYDNFKLRADSLYTQLMDAKNYKMSLFDQVVTMPESASLEVQPNENDTIESLELQINKLNKKIIGDDTFEGIIPPENQITNKIEKLKQQFFENYAEEFDSIPKNKLISPYLTPYKDDMSDDDEDYTDINNLDFTDFEYYKINQKILPYINDEKIKEYYNLTINTKELKLLDTQIESLKLKLSNAQKIYANIKYSSDCECCAINKNILSEMSGINYLEHDLEATIKQNEEIKINNALSIKHKKNYIKIKKARFKHEKNQNFDIYQRNILVNKILELENIIEKIHSNQNRNKVEQLKSMIKYLKYPEQKEKYDRYIKNIDDATKKISKIENELKVINSKIQHYDLSKTIFRLNKIAEKIPMLTTLNENIKNISNNHKIIQNNIITIQHQNNKIQDDIKQQQSRQIEFEQLTLKRELYDHYHKMLGETKLPFSVMKNSIDNIINDVNNILNEVCNFQIAIEIIETKTTSNEFKNKTRIMIEEYFGTNKITINSHMGSGFQKFVIDLAFRIAFINNISGLPKFLIVDEGFGSLDEANRSLAKDALCKIVYEKKYLDFMIIISHQNEFNNISKSHIIIEQMGNTKKYSKILFGTPVKQMKCIGTQNPPDNVVVDSEKKNVLTPEELAYELKQFSIDSTSNPKKIVCKACNISLQWVDNPKKQLDSFNKHCKNSKKHINNIKVNYSLEKK